MGIHPHLTCSARPISWAHPVQLGSLLIGALSSAQGRKLVCLRPHMRPHFYADSSLCALSAQGRKLVRLRPGVRPLIQQRLRLLLVESGRLALFSHPATR
jgi:hypothetical protein